MIKRQDDISRDRRAARGPPSSALPRPGGGLPGLPPPARHVSTCCYHREQASEALFIECSLIAHDALPVTGGVQAGLAAVPGSQAGQHNGLPRSPTLARLLIVLALGASLHAVGQRASIATLITVSTLGRRRRRRRPRARRPGRRGGRPDRRARQRRRAWGSGCSRRSHAAVLHGRPAAGVALGDPGLDAPPRIHMSVLRWRGRSTRTGSPYARE
jgi:hypothetical protein